MAMHNTIGIIEMNTFFPHTRNWQLTLLLINPSLEMSTKSSYSQINYGLIHLYRASNIDRKRSNIYSFSHVAFQTTSPPLLQSLPHSASSTCSKEAFELTANGKSHDVDWSNCWGFVNLWEKITDLVKASPHSGILALKFLRTSHQLSPGSIQGVSSKSFVIFFWRSNCKWVIEIKILIKDIFICNFFTIAKNYPRNKDIFCNTKLG